MHVLYRLTQTQALNQPSLTLALVERLPYEPASMYRAKLLGGPQWLHWTHTNEQLAALYNVTVQHAKISAKQRRTALTPDETAPQPTPQPRNRKLSTRDDLSKFFT